MRPLCQAYARALTRATLGTKKAAPCGTAWKWARWWYV